MKRFMKGRKARLCLSLLAFVFTFSGLSAQEVIQFNEKKAVKDDKSCEFTETSSLDFVKNMTCGWNLGNTMEAVGISGSASETFWGQPSTTKAMIDSLAASGIKSIRIPVSWSNHMDKKYTIAPSWMKRVKQIVDWAIEDGMYVIINTHHDNWENGNKIPTAKGYYPNQACFEESERFLTNVWTQISLAFNNGYDQHLIFETLNEPRLRGTNQEWWNNRGTDTYKEGAEYLNKLNQVCLNAIRKSGGNNAKRFVMIPGLRAAVDSALAPEFSLPQDSAEDKLILSVHMYDPQDFAMNTPGAKKFVQAHKDALNRSFDSLYEAYISKGIPVVIGEYAATNKDNLEERVKWTNFFLEESRKYGMTACLWDNGGFDASTSQGEKYGFFDRRALKWVFPEIIDAIVKNTNSTVE
ncbi:MAG: glycoside hydrolase family 5 protein [Treponema sp.]|nr:glycoside hydrolase family 5 protein [Treponema sp.]